MIMHEDILFARRHVISLLIAAIIGLIALGLTRFGLSAFGLAAIGSRRLQYYHDLGDLDPLSLGETATFTERIGSA